MIATCASPATTIIRCRATPVRTLTTVAQNYNEIGRIAVELLLHKINARFDEDVEPHGNERAAQRRDHAAHLGLTAGYLTDLI